MITQELIARINELARKSRTEGLTSDEKAEQHELRQQYLKGIRAQVKESLDAMTGKDAQHHHHHDGQCSCHSHNGSNKHECGCGDHDHSGKKCPTCH